MLQFDKSQANNTNAVWLDTVQTSSGYYDTLIAVYSQSYDQSNGTFNVVATSTPNQYRSWLIISNSGSLLPDPSGQYDVSIWTATFTPSVWNQVNTAWASFNETWENAGEDTPVAFIYSDRAYISGSNEQEITQYVSSNENGTYITYNG